MNYSEIERLFREAICDSTHHKKTMQSAQSICGVSREIDLYVISLILTLGPSIYPSAEDGAYFAGLIDELNQSPHLEDSDLYELRSFMQKRYTYLQLVGS